MISLFLETECPSVITEKCLTAEAAAALTGYNVQPIRRLTYAAFAMLLPGADWARVRVVTGLPVAYYRDAFQLHQFHEYFGMLFSDSQQGFCRTAGFAPPLFPILNCAQTYSHQTSKSRLRQLQSRPDDLRRGRWVEPVSTKLLLAHFVGLDLLYTFQNFLTNITLRHS